ncbi:hypothetical protein RSO01_87470 [Reyranella soli]|uniref:Uncharacterized protein n=1 Tax=Reyranella soli TaxID=1230389 RepID=A0A512NRK5_9HYPH|nr:hypothetical protein RSO01_87470 [Reyranella soli]
MPSLRETTSEGAMRASAGFRDFCDPIMTSLRPTLENACERELQELPPKLTLPVALKSLSYPT